MELKEKNIYINKKTGSFITIQEITKTKKGSPYHIVTCGCCTTKEDIKHNIHRLVFEVYEFEELYKEENDR